MVLMFGDVGYIDCGGCYFVDGCFVVEMCDCLVGNCVSFEMG